MWLRICTGFKRRFLQRDASMRALWSDRPNCSHNVSQKLERIRRFSDLFEFSREILREIWREFCRIFSDTQNKGGSKNSVKISEHFSWEISCLEKIFRANFVLQTCRNSATATPSQRKWPTLFRVAPPLERPNCKILRESPNKCQNCPSLFPRYRANSATRARCRPPALMKMAIQGAWGAFIERG